MSFPPPQHHRFTPPTSFLPAPSIRENILYGRESASEAEVIEAAKAANAHSYISALPDAYETNVSGWQAQAVPRRG